MDDKFDKSKFDELKKELKRLNRITGTMIFCRPWAYDEINKMLKILGDYNTELYKSEEIPEEYIAIIVDKNYFRKDF